MKSSLCFEYIQAWQNGADIISNSWGDQGGAFYNDLHSSLLESAIDNALTNGRNGRGCIIVFSAGNYAPVIDYPASYRSEILCIGSIALSGYRSAFSSYGTKLDVVAPGGNILSTLPNNQTGYMSGTSMAAPHITAAIAYLKMMQLCAVASLFLSTLSIFFILIDVHILGKYIFAISIISFMFSLFFAIKDIVFYGEKI